jgi:TonB family protein
MKLLFYIILCLLLVNKAIAQQYNQYVIHPNEAKKHIGEKKQVYGEVYKVEIRKYKTRPDSALMLLYFGDINNQDESFISIIKVSFKHDTLQAKWARWFETHKIDPAKNKKRVDDLNGAEGKIILFEGKPAIITDYDNMEILEPVGDPPPGYDPKKDLINQVYSSVDKQPEFPGGTEGLNSWLKRNLKWPNPSKDVSGKVLVSFVVERDGSLTNIRVTKGLEPEFDTEAIRVIRASPKWIPGMNNGKHVRVAYTVPVSFSITQ